MMSQTGCQPKLLALEQAMVVVINGEPREIPAAQTIAALVASLGLEPAQVAVELEHDIVRRADWGDRVLAPGARLEIVRFVGGG